VSSANPKSADIRWDPPPRFHLLRGV
jgi:hypothetical protein